MAFWPNVAVPAPAPPVTAMWTKNWVHVTGSAQGIESEMLEIVNSPKETSRLSCQVTVHRGHGWSGGSSSGITVLGAYHDQVFFKVFSDR